jgi:hypothetical protein
MNFHHYGTARTTSYCMDATAMSLELHGWGNHAVSVGAKPDSGRGSLVTRVY